MNSTLKSRVHVPLAMPSLVIQYYQFQLRLFVGALSFILTCNEVHISQKLSEVWVRQLVGEMDQVLVDMC